MAFSNLITRWGNDDPLDYKFPKGSAGIEMKKQKYINNMWRMELIDEHTRLTMMANTSPGAIIAVNSASQIHENDYHYGYPEKPPKVKQLSPAETEVAILEIEKDFKKSEVVILKDIDEILDRKVDSNLANLAGKGFNDVPGVKEAELIEEDQLASLERAELIEDYHKKYPGKLFITEAYLNKLCEKHGLVFAKALYFIGEIPDENVKEIANFRVLEGDKPVISEGFLAPYGAKDSEYRVVAPTSQFKKEGLQQVGHELREIPDPIVLAPVKGGFLIVSMWGPEKEIIEKRNE